MELIHLRYPFILFFFPFPLKKGNYCMPKDKKDSTQVPRKVYHNILSSEVGGIWLQGCH